MPLILLIVKIYIKILISKVYKLTMKILAIQNKMGIGDTVIFLPFIKAISKKFKVMHLFSVLLFVINFFLLILVIVINYLNYNL